MPKSTTLEAEEVLCAAPSFAEIESAGDPLMARLKTAAAQGRKIVIVQGLGFVGAAVAAVVAGATRDGRALHEVVGVDLANPAGCRKVASFESGDFPFPCPDPELARLTRHAVVEIGNLHATTSEEVYAVAVVIIVDVPLDVKDRTKADARQIEIHWAGFEAALRIIGRRMRPDALVLVETTVPIGTTQRVAQRILREERVRRGITQNLLLAHAYERVMPGPKYANSIRRFWRSFAGIDEASTERARQFLGTFIETAQFPLRDLKDPHASELAKLLENSYRAANIALIYEWTLLAEEIGVNLFEIVDSIRVRQGTHDNMRYPGFGVGGYCLTKDSLLAQWSLKNFFGSKVQLGMTLEALRVNYHMPLHALDLARGMLGGSLGGRKITLCGLCYLPDVPDTRNAPLEIVHDQLAGERARVRVHDPLVQSWPERPHAILTRSLSEALRGTEAVLLAVNHAAYGQLSAAEWAALLPERTALVDASNVLSDGQAEFLHDRGHRLMGVGKGHWRKRGYDQHA